MLNSDFFEDRGNGNMIKKLKAKAIVLILFTLIVSVFCYIQNNFIEVTHFAIASPKIPEAIRIVHLSDLHGKEFSNFNKKLVELIKSQSPDIIVFTGDLIDRNGKNLVESVDLLKTLNLLTSVYYIPGNHEYWSGKERELFTMLKAAKVNILDCEMKDVSINESEISILGMNEIGFDSEIIESKLKEFEKTEKYKILLTHYPENLNKYSKYNVNLIMAGHAHGGQFIIPFVGGIFAPGQGLFPHYHNGLYSENGKNLIVNRGLGNSVIPIRIFNRPEIGVIDLQPLKK